MISVRVNKSKNRLVMVFYEAVVDRISDPTTRIACWNDRLNEYTDDVVYDLGWDWNCDIYLSGFLKTSPSNKGMKFWYPLPSDVKIPLSGESYDIY